MSHKHFREGKTNASKNLAVVSKCLAIVLIPKARKNSTGDDFENNEADDTVVDPVDGNIIQSSEVRKALSPAGYSGKELLQDFKIRNKTCYWNPSLVESIKSLECKGFVEPCTILVTAEDIHIENLRSAWARRVLKAPAGFLIERIGDVSGIEMQVIPQTQFIPLPDALCNIIMDLNMRRIVATMEVIWEKLTVWYKDMTVPSQQLLFDTLASLIRDRKVFHTGSGYFVVTPDTNRLQNGVGTGYLPTNASWLPYHPMYVPVFQGQVGQQQLLLPSRAHMRSISCQVTTIEESDEEDIVTDRKKENDRPGKIGSDTKSSRSDSLKRRDGKDDRSDSLKRRDGKDDRSDSLKRRDGKDDRSDSLKRRDGKDDRSDSLKRRDGKDDRSDSLKRRDGKDDIKSSKVVKRDIKAPSEDVEFRRSASLKVKGDKAKVAAEMDQKPNNEKQEKKKGEKTSIFSRLFSRKKKHKDKDKILMPPPPPPPPPSIVPSYTTASSSDAVSEGKGEKEYGTFSAQFPPPEWVWYHQQLEKQKRTETWISQQSTKVVIPTQASKVITRIPTGIKVNAPNEWPEHIPCKSGKPLHPLQIDYMAMRASSNQKDKVITNTEVIKQVYDGDFVKPHPIRPDNLYESFRNPSGTKHHRKSRDFDKVDEDRKHHQAPPEYAVIDPGNTTPYPESNVYHSVSALSPVAHLSDDSTYAKLVEQPKLGPLHSTPRYEGQNEHTTHRGEGHELKDRMHGPPDHSHRRKSHRTRRRPHRVYSCHDGHGDDISYEYKGRLPNKNSSRAQSRDSGVNCVGTAMAVDPDKRQPGPVYENTSNKQYVHQHRHTSQHPNSTGNHVHFEINKTAASETSTINTPYLTDCTTTSLAYQSDVTNLAYNSVVYGSNLTDMAGGSSVMYHTITSSNLESSGMPMPQNSLQSAFYSESALDLTSSNVITCKADMNPKMSRDVYELHGSPDTIIVDVVGSPTERQISTTSMLVLEQVKDDVEEVTSHRDNAVVKCENRQKETDVADGQNVNKRSGNEQCLSNRKPENEQEYEQSQFSESKPNKETDSQSMLFPALRRQDVVIVRDHFVSDSGFSSPRNPEKPTDRRVLASNMSNSASENSDGLGQQDSGSYPQHNHQNMDSSNTHHSSTNGSSSRHSNSDLCMVTGNEHQRVSPNGDCTPGTALGEQDNTQHTHLQKHPPKVKQSSSLNSLKSCNYVQQNLQHHHQQNLAHHYQPAAKIVQHPDVYNSHNIMYIDQNPHPVRVPSQSLNHQKPHHKQQKRERPRSVDLWRSNTPSDLHKFEEEQLSRKYGANGEFEVMGVL